MLYNPCSKYFLMTKLPQNAVCGPIFDEFISNRHNMKFSAGCKIILLLLAVTLTGCKKNIGISEKQAILFEFEYVNYAWSYQHYGFIIDSEGNVLAYNNPESWNFPDRELRIGENQVAENLSMCTYTGITVSKAELLKYSGHIKNIASSKVTALKNAADDAGSAEYICYQYSGSNGMYKGTIIRMEGDFTCENLNFYSKKVAEWMKAINNSLPAK